MFQCVILTGLSHGGNSVLEDLKKLNKTIGIKQSIKAVENNDAKSVYIAKDADDKVVGVIKELCKIKSVEIIYIENMKQLGKACGIDVGAAAVCILKERE
jgi:large subunit ribosomal protein L7A